MSWKESTVVEQRKEFIQEYLEGKSDSFKALCQKYGISEKTGHKWKNRFLEYGYAGLCDRSRAPENSPSKLDEDTVMMDALDSGAADFEADGAVMEITTDPDAFNDVVKALEEKGYTFVSAEIEMVPQNYITLSSEGDVKNMEKLIDMLEDSDDVQNVFHNWNND